MTEQLPVLAAVDLGTSAVKAGLYTVDGRELATGTVQYETSFPRPAWCEQDADDWWYGSARALREAIDAADVPAGAIAGVSVSGQAPTCLPIDEHGEPLRPAIIWVDRRATDEADWVRDHVGSETVERISGNRVDGFFAGYKWLWLARNEPELMARTWKFVQANNYVAFRLSGEIVIDESEAGLAGPCFDLGRRRWSDEMLEALGIPASVLPEVVASRQVVGKVTADAARETGLPEGTPVVAGGADFACSMLGAGVLYRGEVAQVLGTAGNILAPVGPEYSLDARLVNTVHLTGDYLTAGSVYAGGILQWFRDEIGQPEVLRGEELGQSAYALLDEAAEAIPPGSEGLIMLAYLMGERTPLWDPYARGMYVGITPYHTRAHLYRATLEGIAFGLRNIVDIITELGVHVTDIVSVDGGGKSAVWRRIFADVFDARVHRYAGRSATQLGNVALAGVGAGVIPDLEVTRSWREIETSDEPDPARVAHYAELHRLYRRFYEGSRDLFPELARLGSAELLTAPAASAERGS